MFKARIAWFITCSALCCFSAVISPNTQAEMRLSIPEDTFGPPFYARLEFSSIDTARIPTNGEWAALVLYRQRQCIPDNFNLLELFDVPVAFDCPLNGIEGYEVYANAPGVDFAPRHTRLTGTGDVPVWFVRLDEFDQAAADGVVTILEFEEMPSLRRGRADFYDELLRPSQSNPEVLIHIQANGRLNDGGAFRLIYTVNGSSQTGTTVRTRIEFPSVEELPIEPPLSIPFTGHWFEPDNPGEGFGLHPVRGQDQLFGTWYTVDGNGQQIWYALDSKAFDGLRASFDVLLSSGPDPEAVNGVALEKVGEMEIDFMTCSKAITTYELQGVTGQMVLVPLVPVDNCRD